jgi:hypothetical protein
MAIIFARPTVLEGKYGPKGSSGPSFVERVGRRLGEGWGCEGARGYGIAWIMWRGKFFAPRKFYEAGRQDVEAFYRQLVDEGMVRWKVAQADEAVRG